jgi:hypothetical protein
VSGCKLGCRHSIDVGVDGVVVWWSESSGGAEMGVKLARGARLSWDD